MARIARVRVGTTADQSALIDRTVLWTGDTVDRVNDLKSASLHQIFTYTPTRRLLTASSTGSYGALSWTYDPNGNRASETANGVSSTYAYPAAPAASNRLTSVTGGGNTRSLTYDAAGNILTDSRTGALGIAFTYDVEGRLRTATPSGGSAATYGYDAFDRLASRAVNGVATLYVHDLADHIIAETDGAGVTRREYIWLNDIPIAVVDGVNTATPTMYYVHTDHLGRPIEAMSQSGATVWEALYAPFGAVHSVFNAVGFGGIDVRFPGQWFQLESGLAYNWHRHYDASLGRYVQPDPIGYEGGRSLYGYAGQNPLAYVDPEGRAGVLVGVIEGAEIGGALGGPVGAVAGAVVVGVGGYLVGDYLIDKWLAKSTSVDECSPTRDECNKAKKPLKEVIRISDKLNKKLPENRIQEIRGKIANGTITSDDLPGDIQNEFPPKLRGKTLSEIERLCRG